MWRELGQGLLHLLYPGLCLSCGQALEPSEQSFCLKCRDSLLVDPLPSCPRCAETIGPFVPTADGCSHCRNDSFAFESVMRLGPYEGARRDVVLRMKHHANEGLAELMGELWARRDLARFQALGVDVVVPIPLHWWRRWRRGYNQSAALAKGLTGVLGWPCHTSWLRRTRATSKQTALPRTVRRENPRGAFCASPRVAGHSVLLVDDVLTTGATAHAAASALRKGGAERVIVAALCRASE
jgi:ComF family protein